MAITRHERTLNLTALYRLALRRCTLIALIDGVAAAGRAVNLLRDGEVLDVW
ncbi:hypothetical protein ACNKHP_25090 [Shigella boydii]